MNSPGTNFPISFLCRKKAAFSLVELLAVVAMVSLLLAAVASVGFSDQTSSTVRHSLISLSTQLELARQSAVSQNTYTYVALTSPSGENSACYIASFISSDGVDSAGSLQPLTKVTKLENVKIASDKPAGSPLALPGGAKSPEAGNLSAITFNSPANGALTFDRVIKFTPQGLALIYESPVEWIQLVVVPQKGAEATASEVSQASAITVAGLTGRVFFHRP